MSTPLLERDYNLITEYIDGQLSGEQRQAFEKRLDDEPALRAEYEALRDTVGLLKMANRVRVPRNFTLDPAVYGKPQRTSWLEQLANLFGPTPLAAASGAIASLLVFAGVLAVGSFLSGNIITAATSESIVETVVVEAGGETIVETVVLEQESAAAEMAPMEESAEDSADAQMVPEDESSSEEAAEAPEEDDMADSAETQEGDEDLALPPEGGGGIGGSGGGDGDSAADADEVTIEEAEGEQSDSPAEEIAPMEEPTERTFAEDTTLPTPPPEPLPLGPVIAAGVALVVGFITFVFVRRRFV